MACITYCTNEATCYVIGIRDKQEEKEEGEGDDSGGWTDSAASVVRIKR